MNKLFNNHIVSFVFGLLLTAIVYILSINEVQAGLFALSCGGCAIIGKELINNQMLDNPINVKTMLIGFIGCLTTFFGSLLC